MLSSNISSTCPHNMANFGPLAAEILSLVWSTPGNFNGFRVFGSVTARHSSSGRQPQTAALNRGRHLYSAGRPPRWAFAHISSCHDSAQHSTLSFEKAANQSNTMLQLLLLKTVDCCVLASITMSVIGIHLPFASVLRASYGRSA